MHERGNAPCKLVQGLLQEKIQQIEQQIQHLLSFKAELETYRDRCQETPFTAQAGEICPLIESVDKPRPA